MLTESEKRFIEYWESVREKEGSIRRQILLGIPYGLLFSLPICLVIWTAKYWYVRAEWEANTRLNPVLLIVIVLAITIFAAFFYKQHQFEQRDQQYKALKYKQKKEAEEQHTDNVDRI